MSRRRLEAEAVLAFRLAVLERCGGECERCGGREDSRDPGTTIEAHHLVTRARGVGWPGLHDPELNGAGLCRRCHDDVHHRGPADRGRWIRPRPR